MGWDLMRLVGLVTLVFQLNWFVRDNDRTKAEHRTKRTSLYLMADSEEIRAKAAASCDGGALRRLEHGEFPGSKNPFLSA